VLLDDGIEWRATMSNKSVWNRGKHNGGGLSGNKRKGDAGTSEVVVGQQQGADSPGSIDESSDNPINRVGRMNRDNWVVRPTRIPPKDSQK
jgi:hypothetical protein